MNIPIFLSYPQPFTKAQETFISKVQKYLTSRGFEPRTLGVSDYDVEEPLTAIRRMLLESNGMLVIGFRRTLIEKGSSKPKSNNGQIEKSLDNNWLTSPWCHIEPAMAYQIGLPILILRENGVIADGILEKGITGTYLPEFNLENENSYLNTEEWNQIIGKWEGNVRQVVSNKGKPPKLF
tara:strand:- start:1560 stop:2099 length:540 start_codon:yes stop_codon:yes gene_type:complete